ncbi:VanZ family protein [Roseovarius sp. E0-M6]|uniref:VanZ family protein n=1 Tax=Roseovarius sp. E0-M6 TaxID=3127118 RepID=UPI0030103C72
MTAYLVTALIVVLITVLALVPFGPATPVAGSDKLGHALAFFVLVLPLACVAPQRWLAIWLGAVTYGALIEIVQPLTGRMAEMGDLVADGAGAAVGIFLGIGWAVWRGKVSLA